MTDLVERLRDLLTAAILPKRREIIEEAAEEIERLRGALDDEMQAHCTCVEMRDEAILEADRLKKEFRRFLDVCGEGSARGRPVDLIDKRDWDRARLATARRIPPGSSVE